MMANIPRRRLSTGFGPPPSQKFSPFAEVGAAGFAVFGGRVISREKSTALAGTQRWVTYSDMAANTSIIASGIRYFLNIIASAKWTVSGATDKGQDKQVAEFVEDVLNDMVTPLRRVLRRSASYRFYGFGIQEWQAKRRLKDQKIGLQDIESRPQRTIDRWEIDEKGNIKGVWQVSPQTSEYLYLPRNKVLYIVEDSLTDSPEGLGLFRHLYEPYARLQKYLLLEGRGFERDLRGIPIGRVPYQAIRAAIKSGTLSEADGKKLVQDIENFVSIQSKSEDTSIVLDSAPYVVENDSGKSISGVMQYGLELLNGQAPDFAAVASGIGRLNFEMARIIGVEHLMIGGETASGNRSLAEDKSRNFYLVCNGALDDIVDGINFDIIPRICDLNGIPEEQQPRLAHSDVSFRAISEITASLQSMAAAGAILQPNDPAINQVRELLGLDDAPPVDPAIMGMLGGGAGAGLGAGGGALAGLNGGGAAPGGLGGPPTPRKPKGLNGASGTPGTGANQ